MVLTMAALLPSGERSNGGCGGGGTLLVSARSARSAMLAMSRMLAVESGNAPESCCRDHVSDHIFLECCCCFFFLKFKVLSLLLLTLISRFHKLIESIKGIVKLLFSCFIF